MPTKNGDASVTPNQPWTQDGTALVAPIPGFPEPEPRTMALDNRFAGAFAVSRSDFPEGMVVVPAGHEPSGISAILPIKSSSGNEVLVDGDFFVAWPDGFVIWFLTQ